jgi:hypothetical protein
MDETAARELIERFWKAIDRRDFDVIGAMFDDDVPVEWPQSGG